MAACRAARAPCQRANSSRGTRRAQSGGLSAALPGHPERLSRRKSQNCHSELQLKLGRGNDSGRSTRAAHNMKRVALSAFGHCGWRSHSRRHRSDSDASPHQPHRRSIRDAAQSPLRQVRLCRGSLRRRFMQRLGGLSSPSSLCAGRSVIASQRLGLPRSIRPGGAGKAGPQRSRPSTRGSSI